MRIMENNINIEAPEKAEKSNNKIKNIAFILLHAIATAGISAVVILTMFVFIKAYDLKIEGQLLVRIITFCMQWYLYVMYGKSLQRYIKNGKVRLPVICATFLVACLSVLIFV